MEYTGPVADQDGIYELVDGTPVQIKQGQPLPLGATRRGGLPEREESPRQQQRRLIAEATAAEDAPTTTTPAERAKGASPENRAKTAAPERQ